MSKRRYTLAKQIEDDIDKCYERSKKFYAIAEEMDKEADRLFKNPHQTELAKEYRQMAKAKRTRAYNLVNKKAKELGEKLSVFRTATMSILPDNSIPA